LKSIIICSNFSFDENCSFAFDSVYIIGLKLFISKKENNVVINFSDKDFMFIPLKLFKKIKQVYHQFTCIAGVIDNVKSFITRLDCLTKTSYKYILNTILPEATQLITQHNHQPINQR